MADDSENVYRAVRLLREAIDVFAQTNKNVDTSSSQPTLITRLSTNDHTSTSTALTSRHSPAGCSKSSGSCSRRRPTPIRRKK